MTFTNTGIEGVLLVTPDVFEDARGQFVRAWMPDEFAARGLDTRIAQGSLALTRQKGTIRGMHFQAAPFEEAKVVRAVKGAVFDVAVDLRPDSPTFKQWYGAELTADNLKVLYIPKGFAHGYLTLTDRARVHYQVSEYYQPEHQGGYRYNDPAFGIAWPTVGMELTLSERDATMPHWRASDRPLPG
jgi:dTDP-4-dehydrorhamnose 3,5-epimerase